MRTRTLAPAFACACIVMAFPGAASAATLMGSDLSLPVQAGATNNTLTTFVQSQQRTLSAVSNDAPVSGVLVAMKMKHSAVGTGKSFSFRILTRNGATLQFSSRPAHPTGSTAATLTLAASTPAQTDQYLPKDTTNDPVGVPIQAGEYLALVAPANTNFGWWASPTADGAYGIFDGDHSSSSQTYGEVPTRELLVQGVIEPDADGDHYGDETQDACPADPASHKAPCPADVSLTKGASPNPATVGIDLTYTLTVKNESADSAATNVTVADPLPAGAEFVSTSTTLGSCSGTTTVSCSIGTLAPGASAVVTIVVRPTAPGSLTNTATASAENDQNTGNNSATTVTPVNPAGGGGGDDVTAPAFQSLSMAFTRFAVNASGRTETPVASARAHRGTTFVYRLSEPARVLFTIQRVLPGRRVGNRCVKVTRANRGKKKCNRYTLMGRFAHDGSAGKNTKSWSGKIGRKKAVPGRYRATLTATDAAGNKSAPRRIRFRVVRR
jgi:uncharacterized repeat protein (TIGR01451 family)